MPNWVRNSSARSRSGARSRPYARSVTLISAMVLSTVVPLGCRCRPALGPPEVSQETYRILSLLNTPPSAGSGNSEGDHHDDAENDDESEQEQDDGPVERGRAPGEELQGEHDGQHDDADGEQPERPQLDRYHGSLPRRTLDPRAILGAMSRRALLLLVLIATALLARL